MTDDKAPNPAPALRELMEIATTKGADPRMFKLVCEVTAALAHSARRNVERQAEIDEHERG